MPLRPNFIERLLIRFGVIPGVLLDMGMSSFITSAFIGAGEIKLFYTLAEEPMHLEDLANETGSDERALENLLQVLMPLGYIEQQKDGRYGLTKYARKSVPYDSFHKMTPFFKEQSLKNIEFAGKALEEAPEEGIYGWDNVKSGKIAESYQITMRWLASQSVGEVVKKMKMPKGGTRMLDVGGSHGLYCVEMCRKYSEMSATVLDWPVGIENAKQTLEEESDVADRIDTVEADFIHDELPEGYDLAFLGNIIHGNSPEMNKKLFKKIAQATTDIGKIGIVDQFDNISGSRFTKSIAALVGWNLFLFANGRAYKVDEVQDWLNEAGFVHSKVKNLKQSPGFTLLLASK